MKVETNKESSSKRLGKLKVKKRFSPNIGWETRKVKPNQESSSGILGKFIQKIRKVHLEDQENWESSLGK